MVISKKVLQTLISDSKLVITPEPIFKEASIKAHLSGEFSIDLINFEMKDSVIINPKQFILAKVRESITLPPDVCAIYDGYVGVATKGLFTHGSSQFIDPGETSKITLEIFNASENPIELKKDMRIGQYIFMKVD